MAEDRKIGINAVTLKWIAMLVMLLDHITAILFVGSPYYWILRKIGRISFPIYCFLLAEGMVHTRDIRKYALRLAFFAVLSEIPYDLAFYGTIWNPQHQNIFFTLLAGVLTVIFYQYAENRFCRFDRTLRQLGYLLALPLLYAGADFLHLSYGGTGVFLILLFYFLKRYGVGAYAAAGLYMALSWWDSPQIHALWVIPLLLFYNGKKGKSLPKYTFYCFYPMHLMVLFGIHMWLER